jgi:ABC-type lipoprotein export system ATPase subunit
MGDVVSIVGPTGSGKTALVHDIALFADDSTPSRRRVLIDGASAPAEFLEDPSRNPIALITQHTTFLSDLPVGRFLEIHARIRHSDRSVSVVEKTLEFANQLTGEPIDIGSAMTQMSGGQTRALLIADAVVIGNSPIILLDEIENAGIDRSRALELLRGYEKIFIFVTHDVRIALLSDFRLVMSNGALQDLLVTDAAERRLAERIGRLDEIMLQLREKIRKGGRLSEQELALALQAQVA